MRIKYHAYHPNATKDRIIIILAESGGGALTASVPTGESFPNTRAGLKAAVALVEARNCGEVSA